MSVIGDVWLTSKVQIKDNEGLGIVLEDVFTVLGRDTEQFEKSRI